MSRLLKLAAELRNQVDLYEAGVQPSCQAMLRIAGELEAMAAPDRRELQAKGKHPAPCARFCEATAFSIKIRDLEAQLREALVEAQPQQWRLGDPITEEMHQAACKVLTRAIGLDGTPQRMLAAMLAAAPQPAQPAQEPVHFRAVLDAEQVPHQQKTSVHVVGFRTWKAADAFVASELDMKGWRYTIEPLYTTPQAPQPTSTDRLPSIIDAVEFRREAYGLDCRQWSALLGMGASHYSEFVNGKRDLPKSAMSAAYAYGVPADALLQERPDKGASDIDRRLAELEKLRAHGITSKGPTA